MTGSVDRRDDAGVTELRLNRPERRNALTTELLRELQAHLASIQDDPQTRVLILLGAGDVFCAGADVKEFPPDAPPQLGLARIRLVADVLRRLRELEQPTVAAVTGPAIGAGWGLALACDLCFAAREATFSLPEVHKGFRLPGPLVARLIQVVGPVRAAEIVFGGAVHSAEEALHGGWVTRLSPTSDDVVEEARRLAAGLASRPRRALLAVKNALRQATPVGPLPPMELVWNEE
jgi:enoyl-CoA hydratase/carnithine racemase